MMSRNSSSPTRSAHPGLSGAPKLGVPEHLRPLLGPSCITEDEDPQLYDRILAELGYAVEAIDLIDWLLVKDVTELVCKIHRARRLRESQMRSAREWVIRRLLETLREKGDVMHDSHSTDLLVRNWSKGEKRAVKEVNGLLDFAGLSPSNVTAQCLLLYADQFERLDEQEEDFQRQRSALLKQIERRRAGWGRHLRRATRELIDVDLDEPSPHALAVGRMDEIADRQ
jgi:hypothetical protein